MWYWAEKITELKRKMSVQKTYCDDSQIIAGKKKLNKKQIKKKGLKNKFLRKNRTMHLEFFLHIKISDCT